MKKHRKYSYKVEDAIHELSTGLYIAESMEDGLTISEIMDWFARRIRYLKADWDMIDWAVIRWRSRQ
jgi:hypothetical protein